MGSGAEGRSWGEGEQRGRTDREGAAQLGSTGGRLAVGGAKAQTASFSTAPLPLRSPTSEKGLTAREAAQVLGYDNFMTVYNKVHQGAIKVRRRGRNIRIWREDNEELFRSRAA